MHYFLVVKIHRNDDFRYNSLYASNVSLHMVTMQ